MREMFSSSTAGPAMAALRAPRAPAPPARPREAAWFAALGGGYPTSVARQPIVDRAGCTRAYEMLYRGQHQDFADVQCESAATAHVLACCLEGLGIKVALNGRTGYLNVGRDLLLSDAILSVPAQCFVLEILETVRIDGEVIRRMAELRAAGYRQALDDVSSWSDATAEALGYVDSVKIDFLQTDRAELPRLTGQILRHGKTLIAEKIETADDFALATRLGCHYFQGYYFARPEVMRVAAPYRVLA
jgi:EAL and modified HD-GYP domain-containing signal transduction protein